jgi:hypothetical protein
MATGREKIQLRSDDIVWRPVDGEVIVLDRRNWAYISVNPTGAALWEDVVEGTTPARLAERLVSAFGVDEPTASADVDGFLSLLRQYDLLMPAP